MAVAEKGYLKRKGCSPLFFFCLWKAGRLRHWSSNGKPGFGSKARSLRRPRSDCPSTFEPCLLFHTAGCYEQDTGRFSHVALSSIKGQGCLQDFIADCQKNWIHHYDKLNKHKNKNTSQCTIESVARKPVTTTVSQNLRTLADPFLPV